MLTGVEDTGLEPGEKLKAVEESEEPGKTVSYVERK